MNLQTTYADRLLLPVNREVWTATHKTWNTHAYWNRKFFGASDVADRLVQALRVQRTTTHMASGFDYLGWLEDVITPDDTDDLMVQANVLAKFTEENYGVPVDFDYACRVVIKHIIDETAFGFAREARAMTYLRVNFPKIMWQFTTQEHDKAWGIDIVGLENPAMGGVVVQGISVKPTSYARSYYTNEKIWNNRHKEHQHHTRFQSEHPGAVVRMWEEDDSLGWLVTPGESMGCYICDQSHQRVA